MNRRSVYVAVALLLVPALTLPAMAAESQTTVKVALTDMSSTMGMGPAGHGMMGPGMMGYGWSGPGQGQDGSWPMGRGMMRPGMMGSGMMMMGMMGSGMMMMGMMAVRINQPGVKAGAVRFDITNWSRGMLHEMLVVAVDNPRAPLPYDYSQAQMAEDQVKVLGNTGELQPGASFTLDVTLTPGSYLLICNIPGRYAAGMVTPLTVTP